MPASYISRSPIAASAKVADKPSSVSTRRLGRALSFKSKSVTKQRKSRVIYHYTKEELEPYFDISQKEAAKRLKIAVITLKRICKRENFNWPFRANKAKELQERSQHQAAPTQRVKSKKRGSPVRKTIHSQRALRDEVVKTPRTLFSEQEACYALQSLAVSSMHLDYADSTGLTPAGQAFALLPLLCMSENNDVIETIEL